ncbi:hypothetical protein JNJ66_03200 [Candidatus Saccharibacteria bacterium]|nr:hypothetical protein [Candidatus Saccharibacteria bacterium]
MQEVYVTEPGAINLDQLRQLLPADSYAITAGHPTFAGDFTSRAQVLIIRTATTVTPEVCQKFPQLKAVIRMGTGLDNVDTKYCETAGIKVYNAPGANADAAAEYVTAMILHVRRRLYLLDEQRVSSWRRFDFSGTSISEQSVGIVGFGNIGKLLKQKLAGLGASEFYVYDPFLTAETVTQYGATMLALDELLAQADIVSLHLPLTDETRHLINDDKLALMKEGALLINAARGGIVDETALLAAIQSKNLYYVADTVEGEPHVNPALLAHERVVVTPHIASLTAASETAMLSTAVGNFLKAQGPVSVDKY